jgi:hypothetical protein
VYTTARTAPQRLVPPAGVCGRLERPGLINANKRRWHMMCAGAAPPSAHSRTARSGTCASARASDTNTHKGTSQHTPAGLLLRRTDDQQTDTGRDALNCARASTRARGGGTTTADPPFSSTHTGEPLHKGTGPPPQRAGNQPTDSDHNTPDCARPRARLDGNNTSADDTRDCARSRARSDESNTTDAPTKTHEIARAQTTRAPPTTTHKIERACARALTTATNGRSETEGAYPVRQHSAEVLCTHWPPAPTALHLRMQWRGLLSRVGTSSGAGRGGGGARGDAHQNQGTGNTGNNDNTKRGRGGSKKEK